MRVLERPPFLGVVEGNKGQFPNVVPFDTFPNVCFFFRGSQRAPISRQFPRHASLGPPLEQKHNTWCQQLLM